MNKAIQVKVREVLEDGTIQTFGAIQMGDKIIAMDNGDVLNVIDVQIVEELPWVSLSEELLGE